MHRKSTRRLARRLALRSTSQAAQPPAVPRATHRKASNAFRFANQTRRGVRYWKHHCFSTGRASTFRI